MFSVDYSALFVRFDAGESFAQVVKETRLNPRLVREVKAEYDQGYNVSPAAKELTEREVFEAKQATEIVLQKLKTQAKVAESQAIEKVENIRKETKREADERRARFQEQQAEERARVERIKALNAPPPSFLKAVR